MINEYIGKFNNLEANSLEDVLFFYRTKLLVERQKVRYLDLRAKIAYYALDHFMETM
jgi:hypothetical protein